MILVLKRAAAHLIYRLKRVGTHTYAIFARPAFANLKRGSRTVCWCGGTLTDFPHHPSYGVCQNCGTYVNMRPPLPEELPRLYSFDLFWHRRQRMHGHPTIENRPTNDRRDGRIDYWLGLIERFAPSPGRVVEVGPGHGALLAELSARDYQSLGVEPDPETCRWITENMGVQMVPGLFPGVELPEADLFIAFDVLEHSSDPEAFMREAANLLRSGGIVLIQAPIDRYDYDPPFGVAGFRQMFDDVEHLFIFTDESMWQLAQRAGLEVVSMDERLWLHHEICVFSKP